MPLCISVLVGKMVSLLVGLWVVSCCRSKVLLMDANIIGLVSMGSFCWPDAMMSWLFFQKRLLLMSVLIVFLFVVRVMVLFIFFVRLTIWKRMVLDMELVLMIRFFLL